MGQFPQQRPPGSRIAVDRNEWSLKLDGYLTREVKDLFPAFGFPVLTLRIWPLRIQLNAIISDWIKASVKECHTWRTKIPINLKDELGNAVERKNLVVQRNSFIRVFVQRTLFNNEVKGSLKLLLNPETGRDNIILSKNFIVFGIKVGG